MKLLLDTHALLWAIGQSSELPPKVILELKNPDNDVFVSAVSLWEIALKHSIGKLELEPLDIQEIPAYVDKMRFTMIPLEPEDALQSARLPRKENHKDPFDRMLIYQCIKNGYTLVSKDSRVKLYKDDGLKTMW